MAKPRIEKKIISDPPAPDVLLPYWRPNEEKAKDFTKITAPADNIIASLMQKSRLIGAYNLAVLESPSTHQYSKDDL